MCSGIWSSNPGAGRRVAPVRILHVALAGGNKVIGDGAAVGFVAEIVLLMGSLPASTRRADRRSF